MNKLSKLLLVALGVSVLWMGTGSTSLIVKAQEPIENSVTIAPRADIIDWYYKEINGKWYKRQYNFTQIEWIGEWIPV